MFSTPESLYKHPSCDARFMGFMPAGNGLTPAGTLGDGCPEPELQIPSTTDFLASSPTATAIAQRYWCCRGRPYAVQLGGLGEL